jgi:superoxide dismutase, Fe-Mn family
MRTCCIVLAVLFLAAVSVQGQNLPLPELPYGYASLEPIISEDTLRTHHLKHHAGYTRKLNKALSELRSNPSLKHLAKMGIDSLMSHMDLIPDTYRSSIRNNGGGYLNHDLFWKCMKAPSHDLVTDADVGSSKDVPPSSQTEGMSALLKQALVRDFGSVDTFKQLFSAAAATHFGSGWVWLYFNKETNSLLIETTNNQDTPVSDGHTPLLTLDVWEHAYYLDYKNERNRFIEEWWGIVNWKFVSSVFVRAQGDNQLNFKTEL